MWKIKLMLQQTASQSTFHVGAPPIPCEHGAWVILYIPFFIGLAAAWPAPALPSVLLFVAISGVYLARYAASLLLRKRARRAREKAFWLGIFLAMVAVGGLPLLVFYNGIALLPLAGLAICIFLLHTLIENLPVRNRLLRAQWGELVGMTALTLTAPAAYIVAGGELGSMAWCLWSGCAFFFGSGVLHVRMLLVAAKEKHQLTATDRWRLGRLNLMYHALLMLVVYFSASHLPTRAALLLWLAFLPVLLRAVDGTITLSHIAPSFKKSGMIETGYSLWFMLCFVGALHGW